VGVTPAQHVSPQVQETRTFSTMTRGLLELAD
jgi:hypothetical protein